MSAVIGILVGLLVLVRVIGRQVTGSLVTQKSLFLMPVILLGCLYSGITTPTEAAAVAAAYALLVSAVLYRSVTLKGIYQSLVTSARVTVSIGMLIAAALVFNYVITAENIPKTLSVALKAYELDPPADSDEGLVFECRKG